MEINTIVFIIALVIIFCSLNKTNFEPFVTDISGTKKQIIYNTIPYGSSGLFYDYMIGSPYWYNPLDYWLNPYAYYTWGGMYGSSGRYTTSSPHVKRHHSRHHSRHNTRHNTRRHSRR